MEGAKNAAVLPANVEWSDVGSWSSLYELLPKDDHQNALKGNHLGIETSGSLIYGDKRHIATIGIHDLIIVDAGDALLVCAKDQDQKDKEIVSLLERDSKMHYV
jgi:mannose-1-phosphate guanylyltransferase